MQPSEGAKSFAASGDDYDRFMGRYSGPLASAFADAAGVGPDDEVIDVGCGSGALTAVLLDRVGRDRVRATDPSESFVAHCQARFDGLDVRLGRAEEIPFADDCCDRVLAQLVLHFVSEPQTAVREMQRVARPGGTFAACAWDFDAGMQMLRAFWDAALDDDPSAPDEARVLRFGKKGEIVGLFEKCGLIDVDESSLTVASTYDDFDELWSTFLLGIGPAGGYCASLPIDHQESVRASFFRRLGSPSGEFSLEATARCAVGSLS